MKIDNSKILELALQLGREAGEIMRQYRDKATLEIKNKAEFDLVTEADIAVERHIIQKIKALYPTHRILAEESAPTFSCKEDLLGPLWIIDPIDGTTNYAHGHVHVCCSIAFAINGEVQVGVVHAPFLNETYSAVRGEGAKLNGVPIQIKDPGDLKRALVSTGFQYKYRDQLELMLVHLRAILDNCGAMRRLGAVALDLCWIASGRLHAHFEYRLGAWDIAAGYLIAREAGAIIGTMNPIPADTSWPIELYPDEVLVATPRIFAQLKELLQA